MIITARSTEEVRAAAAATHGYTILGCSDAIPVRFYRQDRRAISVLVQLEEAPDRADAGGHNGLSLYYATSPAVRMSHLSLPRYASLPRAETGMEWLRDYAIHRGVPAQLEAAGALTLTGRTHVLGRTRSNPGGSRIVEGALASRHLLLELPRVEAAEVADMLAASMLPVRLGSGDRVHDGIGQSTTGAVLGTACGLHRNADGSTKPIVPAPSDAETTCARCLAYRVD